MSSGLMTFLALVFGTVFLLMQGLVIPVFGEGAKARKRLKKKLGEIERATGEESYSSLLREKYLRRLRPWERALEELPAMEDLGARIEQAGHQYLAHRVAFLSLVLGIVAGAVAWYLSNMVAVAFLAAIIVGYLPILKVNRDRTKRLALFEEQLPDALDTMTRALKAGHPFPATLKMIAEDMEDPIAHEFELTFGDINYGNDVRRAMLGLLNRVPSITLTALVTSVLVQRETGGNLAEVLQRISAVVRGRFRFHRKVKTLSAEGRVSAQILAIVPIILFGAIHVSTPGYMPMLLEDERGHSMLIYAFCSAVIGVLWIRKLLRVEV